MTASHMPPVLLPLLLERGTPKRTGEIKYACGMDMITGVLEVASRDNAKRGAGDADMMGGHG